MTDQVSPLGNLAAGTLVLPLPGAKPPAAQDSATPSASNARAASSEPASAKADRTPSAKTIDLDPRAINAQLQQANSSLQFKVDQSTGISYFKIVDANTGKVIRQVPSADVLAMAQKLHDLSGHQSQSSSGILMDQEG